MTQWLILHTAESTALAAVVWLLCVGLRPPPAVRHALWLLVLVKLLTPPLVRWPWALPAVLPPPVVAPPSAVVAVPAKQTPPPAPAPATEDVSDVKEEIVVWRIPAHAAAPGAPQPAKAPDRPWPVDILEWIWGGSACVAGLVQLARTARLRGLLNRGVAAPAWLRTLTADAAAVLQVRPPHVLVVAGASSPMVCALGAPRLVWPAGLEDRLPTDGCRAVLLHELAHLRRRDHWVGWLLLAGGCVWWWHPLFALVRRRLGREAELACDARVVEAMPGARRAYAEALLEVSQRPPIPAAPILGAASGRRELERRLVMIMRGSGSGRLSWRALVGVGVLGLLTLPAWSLGGGEPPKPAAPPAPPAAVTEPPPAQKTPEAGEQPDPGSIKKFVGAATGAANPPDANEREKKIRELEAKVKDLQKELETLHAAAPGGDVAFPILYGQNLTGNLNSTVGWASPAGAENAEVNLTRVTYKLPAGHAEATAAFLSQHVAAPVLEAKAEGNTVVVTTTPEAQKVIRTFIALVQAKPPLAAPPTPPTTTVPLPAVPSSDPSLPQEPPGVGASPPPTPPAETTPSLPPATADPVPPGPGAVAAPGGEPGKK